VAGVEERELARVKLKAELIGSLGGVDMLGKES
jgi:hypothetical protein